jgi:hypothetical protein
MFSALDWPYKIELVRITEGYTDQSTGDYIPPQESVVEIKGHISDVTVKDLQRAPEGLYELGDRRLYVAKSYGIAEGDIIKITEADGSVSEWKVVRRERSYGLLERYAASREAFLLRRRQ